MFSKFAPGRIDNRPGLGRDVICQKILETTLPNETDARAVFLVVYWEPDPARLFPGFFLGHALQGKVSGGQLLLIQAMKEIGLILVQVLGLDELGGHAMKPDARIVARGDTVHAQRPGIVQKSPELDFAIAQDVRVRRASGRILGQEDLEHAVPVLRGEIDGV